MGEVRVHVMFTVTDRAAFLDAVRELINKTQVTQGILFRNVALFIVITQIQVGKNCRTPC